MKIHTRIFGNSSSWYNHPRLSDDLKIIFED